jgi:NAD(P)-dependent dehydrogenase (short-subunit alcohol dehydrogenase family)
MKLPPSPRAVITGAGSGLGRALALELARRGGRILVTDVSEQSAVETAQLVEEAGGTGHPMACDVSRVQDVERAAQGAEALWGGVDLLVNNAGVAAGGLVGDMPLEDWEWIVRINMWGVIHGCHVFVPRMRARSAGHILNVASAAGVTSLPEMASYNMTKAAVVSLSETLHAELAPHGIHVTALCPTFFRSSLMDSFRSPHARQRALADAFFRRSRTTAEQVARAGLRGLERNRVIVIPQLDGRLLWRLKRLSPGLYHGALGLQQRGDWGARFLTRALGPGADAKLGPGADAE